MKNNTIALSLHFNLIVANGHPNHTNVANELRRLLEGMRSRSFGMAPLQPRAVSAFRCRHSLISDPFLSYSFDILQTLLTYCLVARNVGRGIVRSITWAAGISAFKYPKRRRSSKTSRRINNRQDRQISTLHATLAHSIRVAGNITLDIGPSATLCEIFPRASKENANSCSAPNFHDASSYASLLHSRFKSTKTFSLRLSHSLLCASS